MDFEWDEGKNDRNVRAHGISFARAALVFLDPYCDTLVDDREAYGEERLTVYGQIEGRLYAVTYTMRGERVRIITARKASRHERKRYENDTI